MLPKYFTAIITIYFIHRYFFEGDNLALIQIGIVLLWYVLFNLLYSKKDKKYLDNWWSITNCCHVGILAMFIALLIDYSIPIELLECALLIFLLFFSFFKFTLFLWNSKTYSFYLKSRFLMSYFIYKNIFCQ